MVLSRRGERREGAEEHRVVWLLPVVSPCRKSPFEAPCPAITSPPHQVTPSCTTEMRTKLFPDEAAEAMDELEYHPHHVHAPGTRATTGASVGMAAAVVAATSASGGGGSGPPSTAGGESSPSETEGGAGAGGGKRSIPNGGDKEGGPAPASKESGRGGGGSGPGKGKKEGVAGEEGRGGTGGGGEEGTIIQRMNKTFRPDPLMAYTGDRSTLRFKPKRQEGLTTLRPRQQRTIFDAAQISPMLQVKEAEGQLRGCA